MQLSIVFIVLSIVYFATINGQCLSPEIDICGFIHCGNGNCLSDTTSSQCFRCNCHAGYTGTFCDAEIAAINNCGAPCQNGGQCKEKSAGAYACVCTSDFIGVHCETSVESTHICVSAPDTACKNGGTCTRNGADYLCRCTSGWTGRNCETEINATTCPINVCYNGGTCRMINGTEHCTCSATYTGEICDTLVTITPPIGTGACASSPCLNGAECVNIANGFQCNCPSTHVGTRCETPITTITTTAQTRTTSGSGQANSCASGPCLNGAQCYNNGNTYFCLCKQGFTGKRCDSAVLSTTSTAVPLSTVSACASNPCQNGGSCYKFEDSFICACTTYYTGNTCDTPKVFTSTVSTTPNTATITCANQPCKNGATCYPTGNTYFCFCGSSSLYSGKNCDTPKAAASDPTCPLNCAPGYCIRTGAAQNEYACMCDGTVTPSGCRK